MLCNILKYKGNIRSALGVEILDRIRILGIKFYNALKSIRKNKSAEKKIDFGADSVSEKFTESPTACIRKISMYLNYNKKIYLARGMHIMPARTTIYQMSSYRRVQKC